MDRRIRFQAHRGGRDEVPEHTLRSYRYAWDLGGIPEADVSSTKDDVVICLHDATLARTTDAPDSIGHIDVSNLTIDVIKSVDAGVRFAPEFAGLRVPTLEEVFGALREDDNRELYIDLKNAPIDKLGRLIREFDVGSRIIFTHNTEESLATFRRIAPGVRTMLWIGGEPDEIMQTFSRCAESGFSGLDQVQLHLHCRNTGNRLEYMLTDDFLLGALERTRGAGIDLELFLFEFDEPLLRGLIDMGISWYATDSPRRFRETVYRTDNDVSSSAIG